MTMRNSNEIRKAIEGSGFDWLGRSSFIDSFCEYILKQKKSTHVCINGVWGSGKTTTVFGIIQKLEKLEVQNKPLVIYLDAWKYEHYDHPLFSLLKVMKEVVPDIIQAVQEELSSIAVKPQIGLNLPFFGLNFSAEKSSSNDSEILNSAEYIDILNDLMIRAVKKYKEERGNELIIFVDELDRAKPDFALRSLEMFHHLQDDLPTHVIYSVDMNQLNGIIKHYYGFEYNVEIFVHKVFDVIIPLQKISKHELERYMESVFVKLGTQFNLRPIISLMTSYMSRDQIESLRTINKFSEKLHDDLKSGYFQADFRRSDYYLGGGNARHLWGYLELLIVLNVLLLSNPILVRELVRGDNISQLTEYLLVNKNKVYRSDLWDLIKDSYNIGQEQSAQISDSNELNKNMISIGLEKIFIPPLDKRYDNKSVFEKF